jgi:hypothetical protein
MTNIDKSRANAITVRLPLDLYQATRKLAKKHRVSMNKLLQESLRARLRAKDEQALYDAFTRVGTDEDSNVDYAFEAQMECTWESNRGE